MNKNYSLVYKYFVQNSRLTKKDLQNHLNLSLPTISACIEELKKSGHIHEVGLQESTGGRRATYYGLIKDKKLSIGIDLTAFYFSLILVNLKGEIISSSKVYKNYKNTGQYYQQIANEIDRVIRMSAIDPEKILGVGIGFPALTTPEYNRIFYGKILNNTGLTSKEIEKYIPYPCFIINDAKASAKAERHEVPNLKNAFYIMLSNNVGGASITNGQLNMGDNWKSGEIGHLTAIPFGKKCYCGQNGCLETYLAAKELSNLSNDSLQVFFDDLNKKKSYAVKAWENYTFFLTLAIRNVRLLYDSTIILGGYVGSYMDPYIESIREKYLATSTFDNDASFIRLCVHKKESIATGAALINIEHYFNNFSNVYNSL